MRSFTSRVVSFCWDYCPCHGFCGWIRLGTHGRGLSITGNPPLFSERYGYRKPIARFGRYRMFALGVLA
jgi:hypothetical protein